MKFIFNMLFCMFSVIVLIVIIALSLGRKEETEEILPEPIETIADEKPLIAAEVVENVEPIEIEEVQPVNLGEFKITAYCSCSKCCGVWAENRPKDENGKEIVYTSTGAVATAGRTIAVDPTVIPYGAEIEINGQIYVAEDCGGAIKGNRIDVYFDNHKDALLFGVQYADIYLKV